MARSQSPPTPAQLRNARTLPEQAAALRALKNEIVGHIQKKETWLGLGVLDPIVRTLATAKSPIRLNGKDPRLPSLQRPLSEEEGVRLQALQLVASFANGGPAFLAPLHAARALPALLDNVSPYTNAPQLVVAALRALTDITNAAELARPSTPLSLEILADNVFSSQYLDSFGAMLSFSSSDPVRQSQVTLAAGLIARLCREERHQHALTMAGILDALSTRLASFAVARGHVIPGAPSAALKDGLYEAFPDAAPHGTELTPILEAITAVLGDSKYRAYRLINSPSILAVFPPIQCELLDSREELEHDGLGGSRRQPLTAMDYLLPTQSPQLASRTLLSTSYGVPPAPPPTRNLSESQSSSRTSLNKLSSSAIWDSPPLPQSTSNGDADADEIESPFIPWLVYLVRRSGKLERLFASSILASLLKAGLGSRGFRETRLGLLVVPPLVDMITRNDKHAHYVDEVENITKRAILQKAPEVLARLILDSEYLQKAAFDCGAVKVLSQLLKHAYTPVDETPQPRYWSPTPDTEMDVENSLPLAQLGEDGQHASLVHRIKIRESTLKAIAALAGGKEDYRKAFLAEEIVPYIVESLSQFPRKPRAFKDRSTEKPKDDPPREQTTAGYGFNPISVIIAACHVIRMLSRSVNILRTALVDHGVALPVFKFMKHPDVNVQIAATAAITNLVIEVSPVREFLTEQGVMKVLCEHAHSQNPALRLNALWALKHFIDAVEPDLKKACLRELEIGWLVHVICEDTDETVSQSSKQGQALGVDVDDDDDVDMQPSDEPHRCLFGSNGMLQEIDSSQSTRLRQAEDKLLAVREVELNPQRRQRNDDLAVQEQGLDFIRNFIGRPGPAGLVAESASETTEMIDYLFGELGQDRLFEMLASKLRSRVLHPFSRRMPVAGRETRVLHPQAKIITAVIYILVHMAASTSSHRQMVISQTELLKLLAQQSSSKDKEVRVALCHLIINLTWLENEVEAQACEQRAQELKKLGYYSKMETLKRQDVDLDVRERAKTAVWQIDHALY